MFQMVASLKGAANLPGSLTPNGLDAIEKFYLYPLLPDSPIPTIHPNSHSTYESLKLLFGFRYNRPLP